METEQAQPEKKKKNELFIFLLLKALLAIGFGMAFLLNPNGMLSTFSYLVGTVLIIYGIIEVFNGLKVKNELSFSRLIIQDGVMNVIVGAVLIFWPNLGPNIVVIILGSWILLGGIIQLVIANKYKDSMMARNGRGILTVVLGAIVIFNPSESVRLFSMVLGGLSLLYGIYLLYLIAKFGKSN
jgi:uncharacterized membrane protein HdeD (DUF308 family)